MFADSSSYMEIRIRKTSVGNLSIDVGETLANVIDIMIVAL